MSCVHDEGRSFCPAMFFEEELEETETDGDQVDSSAFAAERRVRWQDSLNVIK